MSDAPARARTPRDIIEEAAARRQARSASPATPIPPDEVAPTRTVSILDDLEEEAPTPPAPKVAPPKPPAQPIAPPASVESAFAAMASVLSQVGAAKELTVIIPTAERSSAAGDILITDGISLSLATPMFIREADCVSFIYDNRYLRLNVTVGVSLGVVVDGERLDCVAMMRSVPLPGTTWSFISFVLPRA